MSELEKKDYERYFEQEAESPGEFFGNMSKYWRCFTADVCTEMKDFLYDYEGMTEKLAEFPDDPEVMDAIVASGRARTVAIASEKAMKAIGRCFDAAAAAFGNKADEADSVSVRLGDHLCVRKGSKAYHGIYAGGRSVVYYNKGDSGVICVKKVPFDKFAQYGRVRIIPADEDITALYTAEEIVRRALSRLGETDYRNSESFVQWCRCGS